MTAESALAHVDKVSVRYEGTDIWILDRVSLDQYAGRITAVIGPSGCGKSTLVRAVCGLIPHSIPSEYRGSILLRGTEIAEAEVVDIATTVAYVGQNPDAAIVTRTVYDEVAFPLQNLRVERGEIDRRVRAVLAKFGLDNRLWDSPWVLSGGQRQRLALAAALVTEPDLLILDEPTSTIDTAGRRSFYASISPLKERGVGVLVIDHDLDPILDIIDHVIALDGNGTMIAQGDPRELFEHHGAALEAEGIWLPRAVRARLEEAPDAGQARREVSANEIPTGAGATAVGTLAGIATAPLTCAEAGIVIPTLNSMCRPGTVTYWERQNGQWCEAAAKPPAGETGAPRLQLQQLRAPERSPAINASYYGGELVALVGPNGSGKTSLLAAIAGLERREGVVRVNSEDLPRRSPLVGYVFQNPEHQFVERTVGRELRVGGANDDRVEELLTTFHLTKHRDRHPLTLSGGQSRRLSVATMASARQRVILLDEPTYGQDWANTQQLMGLINDLRESGATVIMATHDLELAREHATHMIALPLTADSPAEQAEPRARSLPARPVTNTSWLSKFNPFTLFAGVLAIMIALLIVAKPQVNLVVMACVSLLVLTAGATWKRTLGTIAIIWGAFGFMLWIMANAVSRDLYTGFRELADNMTAATMLAALLSLVLLSGIAMNVESLLRAMTSTLRIPYRIASAGVAAVSFLSRFRVDFSLLRISRKLRGIGRAWGIAAPIYRWVTSVVPLIITAVQHGERVALSMDARAFGAYPTRTELADDPWRPRDTVAVIILWGIAIAIGVLA